MPFALAFLETILPLLLLVKWALVRPDWFLTLVPFHTLILERLPLAMVETFLAFLRMLFFMDFFMLFFMAFFMAFFMERRIAMVGSCLFLFRKNETEKRCLVQRILEP